MDGFVARGMMAKAAKGAKKGKGGGQAAAQDGGGEGLGVVPINYLKDGVDPPIKPDSEYPDWLWNMQVLGVHWG